MQCWQEICVERVTRGARSSFLDGTKMMTEEDEYRKKKVLEFPTYELNGVTLFAITEGNSAMPCHAIDGFDGRAGDMVK